VTEQLLAHALAALIFEAALTLAFNLLFLFEFSFSPRNG